MTHHTVVFALCAFAGTTLALGASHPAAAGNAPSVTVSYRDLDLSQRTDAQVLYSRLTRAAVLVCPVVPTYELARFAASQRCVKDVLADAGQRVHRATLEHLRISGRAASLVCAPPANAETICK
jgi:UrcA family protein